MEREKYNRLYVTPVLPYKPNSYDIDQEALRKFLRYLTQPKFVAAGVGIVINPVAGEVFFLSREEKKTVVRIAVEECGGKVPLFAGATDWTTQATVEVAKDAKEAGADGIFILPPSGPSDITISWNSQRHPEIWLDVVKAIDAEVNLPMISHPTVVEVPGWGRSLALEPTLKMCKEVPNIVGWKMTYSYENYKKIASGLRSLDQHVAVLAAKPEHVLECIAADIFDGTATGTLNFAMEPMIDQIEACRAGNFAEGRKIAQKLRQLHFCIHEDKVHHHLRYKIATWLRGMISSPYMRPPMPSPEREEVFALRDILKSLGFNVISNDQIETSLANRP